MYPLQAGKQHGVAVAFDAMNQQYSDVAHTLRAGDGAGHESIPIAFSCKDAGLNAGPISPTLRACGHTTSHANGGGQVAVAFHPTQDPISSEEITHALGCGSAAGSASVAVAFHENQRAEVTLNSTTGALNKGGGKPGQGYPEILQEVGALAIRGREDGSSLEARYDGTSNAILTPSGGRGGIGVGAIHVNMAVRRLTPKECERLQGFPDGYTDIPVGKKNKPAPDGPRYKALGNSMAVPCMRWLGRRIAMVDAKYPKVLEVAFT